jgi:hypothetical protein
MNNILLKKIIVFSIISIFMCLIINPTINAHIIKNKSQTTNENIHYQTNNNELKLNYKLLIITPKKFTTVLKPLLNHKENMGISTKIATLDEIYEHMFWHGRDDAEKIKYFIKKAVEEWQTQYVLLIGGKKGQLPLWHLPVRYVNMDNDWEPHYVSDLYYADIYDLEGDFSSWDSDRDGNYGEWYKGHEPEDKNIDLIPDVAVGRLPCRNIFEVKIMVDKIIRYETTTYGNDLFNNFLTIAGDTYPEYINSKWVGYEGEYYANRAIENMTDFNAYRLFTSDGSLTHWFDIVKSFNKGFGFVYFVGHGSPMTWSNHLPNDHNRIKGFKTYHMPLLFNNKILPVCFVSGCHNCQFDVSVFKFFNETAKSHIEYVPECWGWRMTRKIVGGSIATLGYTALGHTKEDKISFKGGINELEVQFFKQYGQNKIEILGEILNKAINWYLNTYPVDWDTSDVNELKDTWVNVQVVQSCILFGDPSLQIGGYSK